MNKKKALLFLLLVLISIGCQEKKEYSMAEALKYFNNQEHDKALVEFNKVLKFESKNVEALYYRSVCNTYLENYKVAFSDLNLAIQIEPDSGKYLYMRGLLKHVLNDKSSAYLDFEKACGLGFQDACETMEVYKVEEKGVVAKSKLFKQMLRDYISWALQNVSKGNYKEALENLNDAMIIDSCNSDLYSYRAHVFGKLEKYKLSIKDFTKAIELEDNFGEAYYGRALAYIGIKDSIKACKDFKHAEKLGVKVSNKMKRNYCN